MKMQRRLGLVLAASMAAAMCGTATASAADFVSVDDEESLLLPGLNATLTVATSNSIQIDGSVVTLKPAQCTAVTHGRLGGEQSTSGYLDSTWTLYGTSLDSASVEASLDNIGGQVDVSPTQVTIHGPRQTWSDQSGASWFKSNQIVDGGGAAQWSYVRATCDATVGSLGTSASARTP